MRRGRSGGLVLLNAMLLGALALVAFGPSEAGAQNAPRPRGQYTLLASQILGGQERGVFIVDGTSMQMLALRYDLGRREMIPIGHRDLAADAAAGPTPRR
ncbi:MAG: hypothetical protein AB7G17_09720 [Phycisphaerales bacterium]